MFVQPVAVNFVKFMGFRKYLNPEKKIQLFYGFDLSGMWAIFDEMAYRLDTPESPLNVTYGGFLTGVNGGIGILLTDNIMIVADVVPTLLIGTDVKPENSTSHEITKFLNFHFKAEISIAYLF